MQMGNERNKVAELFTGAEGGVYAVIYGLTV